MKMPHYPTMEQNPREFVELLRVLQEMEIRSVLEVGVFQGGTLGQFQWALPDARVVGIDPWPMIPNDYPIPVIRGSSHDPDMRQRARSLNDGERFEFVHIDGDHTAPAVALDWEWAQVEATRLVAFHDIANVGNPSIEVRQFWKKLRVNKRWATDEFIYDKGIYGIGLVYL